MLCALRKSDGEHVIAKEEDRSNAPFGCPECEKEVILRKGVFRTHHFAHKAPVTCQYGTGETELHRQCKTEIFESLSQHPAAKHVALEKRLGTVRPDVFASINGTDVAIEVQLSTLPLETLAHRTKEYHQKGIYVLWLGQWSEELYEHPE